MMYYEEPVELAFIQRQLAFQLEIKMDAQVWFGAVADGWTHEERLRRLNEVAPHAYKVAAMRER